MPFSNTEQISPILAEITRLNPRSILDVGCGLGLYGMLCRIHLDLYHDPEFYRKLDRSQPWNTRIDGIEGCETYAPFIPHWAYDNIYAGNALDIVPSLTDSQYDLILILAMIEHLDQDEGIQLITQLKRIGRAIILSVPKNWQEQRIEGYPLETHRSHWTEQDLRDLGFTRFLPHWGAWLAVYGIPHPPQPNGDDAKNATHVSDQINELDKKLNQVYADIACLGNQITILNESTGQINKNIATSLLNQQIIFDRLSISTRLRSLKKRLGKIFSR
jgi:hypothetical protein